jgi:Domain of unknown function (DUF4260)
MQPAAQAPTTRPAIQRLAWLGVLAATTAFAILEVGKHGAGPLALALAFALAPDLPMLIGANRGLARGQLAPAAVPFYNATHRVWGPLLLLVACTFLVDSAALFTGGLAWLAHVALDRAVGYGLRGRDGFQRG